MWALNWGAGLAAPFTEETAKGSGLLLLIALAPRQVRTAFDGFILGAFIGLGFQIVEDITYAMTSAGTQFGANQIGARSAPSSCEWSVGSPRTSSIARSSAPVWSICSAGPPSHASVGRGLLLVAIPMLLHGHLGLVGGHRRPRAH